MFRRKSFTLIEMLVVVAIIALLATMIVVSVRKASANARDQRRKADIKSIENALEHYAADHEGDYPPSAASVPTDIGVTAGFAQALKTYLDPIPQDPLYQTELNDEDAGDSDGTAGGTCDNDKNVLPDNPDDFDRYCYRYFTHGYDYTLTVNFENGTSCIASTDKNTCGYGPTPTPTSAPTPTPTP